MWDVYCFLPLHLNAIRNKTQWFSWKCIKFFYIIYWQWFVDMYRQCSNDLAFWIVWALSWVNSSWVETFCESLEWSGSCSVMSSDSSVGVTVWIVGAWLRVDSSWVLIASWCCWCSIPLLWGRLLVRLSVPLRLWLLPLWSCWLLVPLVPLWLRCWSLVLGVPVVGWGLVVEDSVITDWEVGALVWVNTCWVFSSWLCWCASHDCQ